MNQIIVGLEIHVELKTSSKMFCGCKNDPFHAPKPNIYTCPVCLGLPGALPVPNRRAVEWCVMLGQALNCEIPLFSKFDRKNYFYPDLAKGYQISQYDQPFAINGYLDIKINGQSKRIGIRRVHMEEDTGKLIHASLNGKNVSLVDFNRCGVPLVEIVTQPDIRSSEEARIFLKKLHQIIRYLDISDADMEKGTMRIEPNISIQIDEDKGKLPPYKVEVKNINSFSFAKKAIDFEAERHLKIRLNGELPTQETRGWNESKNVTVSQRNKEEAQDYRYFPDPDIPPIRWDKEKISKLKSQMPELADVKIQRFMKEYQITEYDASILTDSIESSRYFEAAIHQKGKEIPAKTIANWIINKKIDMTKVKPEELIKIITEKTKVVEMNVDDLKTIVKKVIGANEKAVDDYNAGKEVSLMFLLGQVMKETKGKANAQQVKTHLIQQLSKD